MTETHLSELTFASLDLVPEVARGITDAGFVRATPVQASTLPIALTGKDVAGQAQTGDRKSTRLNSSHLGISYAVFCLKKKKKTKKHKRTKRSQNQKAPTPETLRSTTPPTSTSAAILICSMNPRRERADTNRAAQSTTP